MLFVCQEGGGLVTQSCPSLLGTSQTVDPRLLCPRDCPGKNTGVGCHFLLQGLCPTLGSNLGLPHWQVDSVVSTEPPGKPRRRVAKHRTVTQQVQTGLFSSVRIAGEEKEVKTRAGSGQEETLRRVRG